MTKRIARVLVLLSVGGMTFGWGLGGCVPSAQNAPYVQFLVNAGNAWIGGTADALIPPEIPAWVGQPLTTLYQDLWTAWVNQRYAQDPTYNALLVE